MTAEQLLERIADGRTDLVLDYLAHISPDLSLIQNDTRLLHWCAYYGDVSALRFLLKQGALLTSLGADLGLRGAAFHGHWRLCQFLLEQGANVNHIDEATHESALHCALSSPDRAEQEFIVAILLDHGANPNAITLPNAATQTLMRDAYTQAESPLHRAAAFGTATSIRHLLQAGADKEAQDIQGATPLAWASWHTRPDEILRLLCYGEHSIHPDRVSMNKALLGKPHRS